MRIVIHIPNHIVDTKWYMLVSIIWDFFLSYATTCKRVQYVPENYWVEYEFGKIELDIDWD